MRLCVCRCICICIVFDQAGVTRAFFDGLQAEIILESALQRCGHNFTCLQFYIPLELSRHRRNYTHPPRCTTPRRLSWGQGSPCCAEEGPCRSPAACHNVCIVDSTQAAALPPCRSGRRRCLAPGGCMRWVVKGGGWGHGLRLFVRRYALCF